VFDWEYAQTPEQSSWIASAIVSGEKYMQIAHFEITLLSPSRTTTAHSTPIKEDSPMRTSYASIPEASSVLSKQKQQSSSSQAKSG
jgi:hypothetical protein